MNIDAETIELVREPDPNNLNYSRPWMEAAYLGQVEYEFDIEMTVSEEERDKILEFFEE